MKIRDLKARGMRGLVLSPRLRCENASSLRQEVFVFFKSYF